MEYRFSFDCKKLKGFVRNAGAPSCKKQTTVGHLARTFLLLLFMLCSISVSAQQVEVTLTEASTLPDKIASDQKYTITSQKVSGPINGTDVRYLREMAGAVAYKGEGTDGKLVDLDLTGANIVEGGDYYYSDYNDDYFYTTNNTIGDYMFYQCKLESINLPNSVTSIGDSAFYGCSSLTSITIPNSVTNISNSAFRYCSSLTSITIPNSVTSIGGSAFYGCSSLTSVTIGKSVKSIWDNVFYGCSSLTSIIIPNSVTCIGDRAFCNCSSLTSVIIPNSVTSIGHEAFRGCTGLTSATIGNSVTNIGYGAFADCSGIVKLTSLSTTPPMCYEKAFYGINKQKCTLYVPQNSLDAYKAADLWKDFYNIKEIDPTGISLPNDSNKVVKRYDANGRMMDKPTKGLNILKMSDGTTRKVMVK